MRHLAMPELAPLDPPADDRCDTCDGSACAPWCERRDAERFAAAVAEATDAKTERLRAVLAEVVAAHDEDRRACSMRVLRSIEAARTAIKRGDSADPCAAWERG